MSDYEPDNIIEMPPISLRLFDGKILATCGWKVADVTSEIASLLAAGLEFHTLPDGRVVIREEQFHGR